MNDEKKFNADKYYMGSIFTAALGLMLLGSIAIIFWGADRSLGLADEGLYLLAARYPDEIQQNVSSVYIYTGYLFRMMGFDPIGFRIVGVFLVCFSAFVFWMGFYKFFFKNYLKANNVKYLRLYSLFFIELGSLLHYQWFYMTPNYNTLISIALSTSAGSMLFGLAQIDDWQKQQKKIILSFTFVGLSVGLALFTKFPAGISFLLLYFLTIILWSGINRHQKYTLLASILVGIITWFLVHFLFVQPPQTWWQMSKEGWSLYQAFGVHTPQSKSTIYLTELLFFIYSAIKIYWPCYLIICISYLFYILRGNSQKLSDRIKSITMVIVILFAILLSLKAGIFIDERRSIERLIPFYAVFHLAWILLLLTIGIFNLLVSSIHNGVKVKCSVNVNIVLVFLVALPIAGSVGTANPIYNVPLCFATTWLGAILFLFFLNPVREFGSYWLRLIGILSIGAFTTSQIIQGYIFDPQGIGRNLLQQVEETTVGFPVKNLKLDLPTHQLVKELSSIAEANGFQPGGDVIAFSYIPGLVYAIGGRSPGHPTFLVGSKGLTDKKNVENYTKFALQFADIKRLKNAFILLDVKSEYVEPLLTSRGLDFPNGYEMLGVVVSNGVSYSLWKPITLTKIDLM